MTNGVNYFDKSIPFRNDSDFAMKNLTGMYQAEFSLEAKDAGGICDPAYLKTLENFADWYRKQPNVMHVNTISDTMRRLNKNMHGDNEKYYVTPKSRELAAQYLLLYEPSLPYGLDLNNQINIDKSSSRFSVTFGNVSSRELVAAAKSGERWLNENVSYPMSARAASSSLMFANISERNIKSMLQGTALAVGLISLVLIFALKSTRFGILSLAPNMIPAILAFGFWAIFVGQIGMGVICRDCDDIGDNRG